MKRNKIQPLVWLALGPVVVWRARKRTVGAIEALIASAAEVARPT